jgi:hypothetical protein
MARVPQASPKVVIATHAAELDLVLDAQTDAIRDELRTASETMLRNVAEAHLEPRKVRLGGKVPQRCAVSNCDASLTTRHS